MPRYVIERQYLVPMYEHIFIDALSLEEACRRALDDHQEPWGEHAELDFDGSRATMITRAVEVPELLFPNLRAREDEEKHDLSEILYHAGLEALLIPAEFDEEQRVGFV